MATSTDPFDTTIWAIVSADRGTDSPHGALAFQAAGLPPSGNVTLELLSTAAVNGQPKGGAAAAYNALFSPSQLWVTVAVAPKGPYRIIAYATYGALPPGTELGLTATTQQAPITVEAIDQATKGQLWTFTPSPKAKPVEGQYLIEGKDSIGAIRRASTFPVPGVAIELGLAPGSDKHMEPYSYEMIQVSPAVMMDTKPPSSSSK